MEEISNNNTPAVPAEELAEEANATKEVKRDEVRASVIEEMGLDEDTQGDLIDKMTDKEMGHSKSLSKAIGQKVKLRESLKPEEKKVEPAKPVEEEKKEERSVDDVVRDQLDNRDLSALPMSDELKKEVKTLAKLKGISITETLKDGYIESKIKMEKDAKTAEEAGIESGGGTPTTTNLRGMSMEDAKKNCNMSTKEGRQRWIEWKDANDMH